MPYKEIGKTYPFTSPANIPMDFLVEANCLTGIYGYQSIPGSTSQDINAIDLNAVKNAIEQRGKVKILFMQLSWNVGANITDLVLGAVWITKVTIDAQTVLNSVPSNLMKVLTDLQMIARGDFKAYVDGSVSSEHVWEWSGETKEAQTEVVRSAVGWPADPFPFDQVKNACSTTILSEVTGKMQIELADYSPTITKIEPLVEIITTYSSRQYRDYTEVTYYHTLKMSAKIYFTTQKPFAESPLSPIVIAALAIIIRYLILVVVAGLIVYYAWAKFVESFLVKSSKVTTKTTTVIKTPIFDDEGNIIGYEEKIIEEEKTEETVEPSLTGQLMTLVAVGIATFSIGLAAASALGGKRRD